MGLSLSTLASFPHKVFGLPNRSSPCSHHLVIPEFVSPQLTSDLEDYSLLSFCSSWHSKPYNINGSLAYGEMKAQGRERTILKACGETRWCSQKLGVWALGLLPPHHHTSSAPWLWLHRTRQGLNRSKQNLWSNLSTVSVSLAGWQNDKTLEMLICFCLLCSLHQLPGEATSTG